MVSKANGRTYVGGFAVIALIAAMVTLTPGRAAAGALTSLTVTPTSTASATGSGYCQTYTVTAPGAAAGTSIHVDLTPGGNIDSAFCGAGVFVNPTSGGGVDGKDFTLDSTDHTSTVFGVGAATGSAGTIAITVFESNGTNTPSGVQAKAQQEIVLGQTQAGLVTGFKVSPTTQYLSKGGFGATWTVTAQHGATETVGGVVGILGTMTTSTGATVPEAVRCSDTTDANGIVICTADTPPGSGGTDENFTVTFTVAGSTAATKATLISAPQAPSGATVSLTCGTAATVRSADSSCVVPTSATSLPIQAAVTGPVPGGASAAPLAGVVVAFAVSPAGKTASPQTCLTSAAGTCTTTLALPAPSPNLASYVVSGALSNNATSLATVAVDDHPAVPATTVSVKTAHPTVGTGASAVIQAMVTNQFGNPVGAGEVVTFSTSGGRLSAANAKTAGNGRATVSLTDAKPGAVAVTATIPTSATTPNCTSPASATTGASAGKCSADAAVHFVATTRTTERPSLAASASARGRVTLRTTTHPKLAHVAVQFFRLAAGGKRVSLGTARTGTNGAAVKTVALPKGPVVRFEARVVGLSAKYVSGYSRPVVVRHRR